LLTIRLVIRLCRLNIHDSLDDDPIKESTCEKVNYIMIMIRSRIDINYYCLSTE